MYVDVMSSAFVFLPLCSVFPPSEIIHSLPSLSCVRLAHPADKIPRASSPAKYSRRARESRGVGKAQDDGTKEEDKVEGKGEKKKKKGGRGGEQLMLDLGQRIQVECKECGITYDQSDVDDCGSHEKHHLRLTRGFEWTGKAVMRQATTLQTVPLKSTGMGGQIEVTLLSYDWQRVEPWLQARLGEVQSSMDHALGAAPFPQSLKSQTRIMLGVCKGRVVSSLVSGPVPSGSARRLAQDDGGGGAVLAA